MQRQEIVVNFGDASFAIRISDLQKDRFSWETQRHSNADYELHMILAGCCTLSVEEQQYALSAGEAILIAPGCYHQPLAISDAFQKMSVSFFPYSGRISESIRENGAVQTFTLSENMRQLAYRLLEEVDHAFAFQRDMVAAMLSQIMVYMLRKLAVPEYATAAEVSDAWRTNIIDDFFSEDLDYGTEAQLAQRLHLSRRQLARVMQIHYGMNFRQKLLSARMDRAGWLLRTTELTVTQVYSSVGYNSEAAFYQNFKAYYGVTPRQYRKKQSQK